MSLWGELRRRNVVKVGTAYLVAAWLIIQVVNELTGPLSLPPQLSTLVVVLLGIGFPITLIFAWAFELTPDGIKRTESDPDTPRPQRLGRHWDFAIIAGLVVAVAYFAFFSGPSENRGDTGIGGSQEVFADDGSESIQTESDTQPFESGPEDERAKAEIERLCTEGDWTAAFLSIADYEEANPNDPELNDLWQLLSWAADLESDPPGATVSVRPYAASEDSWVTLGVTPVQDVRVPFGLSVLRFELDGYQTAIGTVGGNVFSAKRMDPVAAREQNSAQAFGISMRPFSLDPVDAILPTDMVRVPGWTQMRQGEDPLEFRDFFLGRYEVTNEEFQAFVDMGGYSEAHRDLWVYPFIDADGNELTFAEAMSEFVDLTQFHGPATWAGGLYPEGEEHYPVTGISFYEAAAFARWKSRELPSVFHIRRGVHQSALGWSLPMANLESDDVLAVGASRALNWNGNYDLIGNVREWSVNELGDQRFTSGGGFSDPSYAGMPGFELAQGPMERESFNGFRLALFPYDETATLEWARRELERNATSEPAAPVRISEETFREYEKLYDYAPRDLNARFPSRPENTKYYRLEHIEIDAAYRDESFGINLYLPASPSCQAPFQTVIYWPESGAFVPTASPETYRMPLEFLPRTCRAVAQPFIQTSFGRTLPNPPDLPEDAALSEEELRNIRNARGVTQRMIEQVKDIRRTLDYLSTRPEIDAESFAFFGYSDGGNRGAVTLAVEPRFKAAVFHIAGIFMPQGFAPAGNPVNFLAYIEQPLLLLSGEFDHLVPQANAEALFNALGSADKKHVIESGGHSVPAKTVHSQTLAWLNEHLGPVN